MSKLCLWFRALRAPFFTASIIPVLVGVAMSRQDGFFRMELLSLTLLITLLTHAGSNLLNDYIDAYGSDRFNENPTPFSGGSRLIQKGLLSQTAYLRGTLVCYSLSIMIAAQTAIIYRNGFIFLLAAGGILLGILYNLVNSYGWGEPLVGLAFGPLPVLGSYLLQTGTLSWGAALAGVPIGFLVMGILILNEFPDTKADETVGKRTWIVRVTGASARVMVYLGVIALSYLTIFLGMSLGVFPVKTVFSCATIPLAVWICLKAYRYQQQVKKLIPVMAGNIGLHVLTGLLIVYGIW